MASKLVEKNEIAQILALIAFVQYLIPIAGGPLITLIFNRTLTMDPGLIYYSLALMTTPAFAIPLYLDLLVLKDILQQDVRHYKSVKNSKLLFSKQRQLHSKS